MSAPGEAPYRITLVGDVRHEIKRLAGVAAKLGKKQEYLDAWLRIESRLSNSPSQFGECRYFLLKRELKCHIGAIQPIAVRFYIHEKSHVVFIQKVFLLEP